MSIFKKKKRKTKKQEFVYIDPDLDIEAEFRKRRMSGEKDREFDEIEGMQYINTQCQLMTEASDYIEKIKDEYKKLGRQMSDISIIESAPDIVRKNLRAVASRITELKEKTHNIRQEKSKLTSSQYDIMEKYSDDFPKALVNLQNDEKYCNAVRHDMQMLEAEKISLKEDIENYGMRRTNIRNISIISLLAMIAVYIIFFVSGQLNSTNGMVLFMVVLLMTAVYVLLIFISQRNTIYRTRLAEKKLARAVMLLNKTKIKYVNIANSVDYQQKKFHVKNSYELSRTYEIYLDEKKKVEKYKNSETELGKATYDLEEMLSGMGLLDSDFWCARLDALSDDKAMKALKKNLRESRSTLMDQIEYNRIRIEESKNNVMTYVKNHPEQSDKVMAVVDSYEKAEKTVDI